MPISIICVLIPVLMDGCYQPSNYSPGLGAPSLGDAVDIAFDTSGNVLIGGVTGTTSSQLPCYWENGSLVTTLPVGQGNYAFAIGWSTVDTSGNFFIAGAVGSTTDLLVPCCWENGALSYLTTGTSAAGVASGILASGQTLYATGGVGSSTSSLSASLWTNGALTLLPLGTGNSYGQGFAVSLDAKGNVYVAGAVGP